MLKWNPATNEVDVDEEDCRAFDKQPACTLKETHFEWAKGSGALKGDKIVQINKTRLLEEYSFVMEHAPMVWLTGPWFPSDVEFHLKHTKKGQLKDQLTTFSKEPMLTPDTQLSFFSGQQPSADGKGPTVNTLVFPDPSELDPITAYHNPKSSKINVAYIYFYPYNHGKAPVFVYFDNHVGDLENTKIYYENGKPYRIDNSEHAWSTDLDWNDKRVEKQGAKPVVYSA